jgi:CheY-like chemotaxis protein
MLLTCIPCSSAIALPKTRALCFSLDIRVKVGIIFIEGGQVGKETPGKPVILVVDDMPEIRVLLCRLLESWGYQAITAEGGREAVSIALSERPELILMDIYMPGGDGLTAAQQIHTDERTSGIPIVAVSAYGDLGLGTDFNRQALSAGCTDYISKPIEVGALRGVVDRVLRRG